MAKVQIKVNGKQLLAEAGSNLLETLRHNGIQVPSLCHDPRLQPFGACRQCLVEVKGARGAVPACGSKVTPGMEVTTNSEDIINLRRVGLELILSEHHGDCIGPCQAACPAHIDIQGFIAYIANGQYRDAAKLIKEKLPLPSSVGKVCPRFCEAQCRRNLVEGPVDICSLKRFAGDSVIDDEEGISPAPKADTGKKVAVIGGGPAGLTAAYYLALEGHRVSIFEANAHLGGMMRYGIPEYRLAKAELDKEIAAITKLCENVFLNKVMGKDFTASQLNLMGYDAVYLALGSWANQSLRLPNEDLPGVYSGIGFLGDVASGREVKMGKHVVVVGGGNTAMDAARTSVRMGAESVTVVYRRSRGEMPANPVEIEQAEEEGVQFQLLTGPVGFKGDQNGVTAFTCVKMELGEPDASGRRKPVAIEGSEFDIPVDMVITATGQKLEASALKGSPEVFLDNRKNIAVDNETMQAEVEWLFAAGDCVTGPKTVVEAVGAARKAALSINDYLNGKPVKPAIKQFNCSRGTLDQLDGPEFQDKEKIERVAMAHVKPEVRKNNFKEFELGFTEEEALKEASRCLSCGCMDVFECRLREYATDVGVDVTKLGTGKKLNPILSEHPHIVRDNDKCVLCGNCVRICQEVKDMDVLGLVNRGSKTVVLPSLGKPLADTRCNSCGQCVEICPTGALSLKVDLPKPGPFKPVKVPTVCPHCSVGCQLELNMAGEQIISVSSPVTTATVNGGNLCVKGSFGYSFVNSDNRLRQPLVNTNGEMKPVAWDVAMTAASKLLGDIKDSKGADSLAVLVSPRMTNEENYLAVKLAKTLGTDKVFSTSAVPTVAKTATFEDIKNSDLILAIGGDIFTEYPIAAHKITSATNQGTQLLLINSSTTRLENHAKHSLRVKQQQIGTLMEAFISYAQTKEIPAALANFHVKQDKIVQLLQLYLAAKNPVLVVDGASIGSTELELVQKFAEVTGAYNRPGSGIIALYPDSNIQGQVAQGISTSVAAYEQLLQEVEAGNVAGVVILSDGSPVDDRLLKAKSVVITPILAQSIKADVILAGATFAETEGTVTNSEGRLQKQTAAFMPLGGIENYRILSSLALLLGGKVNYQDAGQVEGEVIKSLFA